MHFQEQGRTVILRGVNLADGKFPKDSPTYRIESLLNAESCSYIDTPLKLENAHVHLHKLRYLGFNVLRIPVVWEALEHEGPGIYDEGYLSHLKQLVEVCNEYGFKVIINPHQDLWSRHCGGSGAPLWTLHACGLDPDKFGDTHAAIRYSEWPMDKKEKDPRSMPVMMWTTNHNRLAVLTVFALFFGGRDFAPKCVIDGKNIQDYLQDRYFAAYARVAESLGDLAFGFDGMNEPEPGYISWNNIADNEREGNPKIGSAPTPIQGMRLGMGIPQRVDDYRLGTTGPHKTGTIEIKPRQTCWLAAEDRRWKWNRSESWPLNTCVWALNGVWDIKTGELLNPHYFAKMPNQSDAATAMENASNSELSFLSSYWQAYHRRWTKMLRGYSSKTTIFMQPTVFSPPPPREEPLTAYSPHYYDGLTVMKRHWHEKWNADVVGLLRGKYKSKVMGLRIGKDNVRKVISKQLGQLASDVNLPTLIGEIGIQWALDDGKAYRDGDYTDQVKAMDALLSGCDDNLLNYSIWAFSIVNNHEWGDQWNGEDLSIYCEETGSFPGHPVLQGFRAPAAWCRPYVQSLTGQLISMSFDCTSGKFNSEILSSIAGFATIYLPWVHYRDANGTDVISVKVTVSEGSWTIAGQMLQWEYQHGGSITIERAGKPLSASMLGTLVR